MAEFDRRVVFAKGAYVREACAADWHGGKDFGIVAGPYFSIRDCDTMRAEGIEQIVFLNLQGLAFTIKLVEFEHA